MVGTLATGAEAGANDSEKGYVIEEMTDERQRSDMMNPLFGGSPACVDLATLAVELGAQALDLLRVGGCRAASRARRLATVMLSSPTQNVNHGTF